MDAYGHLNRYVVTDNSYTHKKIKPYETRWQFGDSIKDFWIFYCDQVDHIVSHELTTYPSIMEKCCEYTPINVTMCFKYNTDVRLQLDNFVISVILGNIQKTICDIYDIQDIDLYKTLISCYLKGRDVYLDDNGDYCNVISFIFPNCVVPLTSQLGIFRDSLLNNLTEASILRYIQQPKNGNMSDMLLKSPPKGDWTLYGSINNDIGTTMEVTEWYGYFPLDVNNVLFDISKYTVDIGVCDILLPSSHTDCCRYGFDPLDTNNDVEYWTPMLLSIGYCSTRTKVRMTDTIKVIKTVEADDIDTDLGIAKILVPMIGRRTEEEWLIIGRALYNCVYEPIFPSYENDGLEHQAMDIWIHNASERGYDTQSLLYLWSTFSQGNNYTLRSIGWFAKKDAPDSYKSWHKSWYGKSISISMEKSSREHVAFGESYFKYFWLNYCYSESVSVKVISRWYKFSNHSWAEIGPTEMFRALDVFRREVELYGRSLYNKLLECNDTNQKDIINNKIKKVSSITENYGNSGWRKNILEISKDKFIIHNFHKKIDTNKCLTGVHNGVIEVNDKRAFFREGRPEDYITKYSSVDYYEMSDDHPMAIEYMKYMKQIFPDSELVDTQLRFFSSLLYGVSYKYFYIWTGGGDNGKSTLVRLLNATLGDDYVVTVSPSFITRKRVSSSNPTPEIADMKGARLVVIQEPDEGETLQPGVIKEATGGDKIRARKLNDNGGPFLPSYQIVVQCNDIPEAEKQDAMKSRVRIVPFLSKWEDEENMPSPEECLRRNIHKKDPDFMSNIGRYASACLYYMVKYFEKFRSNPINKIPKIVKSHTDTYWNTVDKYYQYINERLEWKYVDYVPNEPYYNPQMPFELNPNRTIDNNVVLAPRDTYYDYVSWLRDTGRYDQQDKNNTLPKIIANISRFLGPPTLDGWLGIQPRLLQVNY